MEGLKKCGRKAIPKDGIYATYVTIGTNDYGTRVESKYFGVDAGALIDQINLNIELVDVCEINAKVYINGKKIFDGESWEVASLTELKPYLPKDWKSKNQLRQEKIQNEYDLLNSGKKLTTASCYPGHILRYNETWKRGNLPNKEYYMDKEFKNPYTIEFYRQDNPYKYYSPKVLAVLEKEELINLRLENGDLQCDVPTNIYNDDINTLRIPFGVYFDYNEKTNSFRIDYVD
jgi:hypothetical protein